jgi:hypothetical protein
MFSFDLLEIGIQNFFLCFFSMRLSQFFLFFLLLLFFKIIFLKLSIKVNEF